jgi:hypothetical protein
LEALGSKAGFVIRETALSPDGGNLTSVFTKSDKPQGINSPIPGNCQRIRDVVERHTAFGHYLSSHPYMRLLRKIGATIREKRQTREFSRGKDILDSLY